MQALDKKIFGTLFFSIFTAVTGVGIVVPLLPVYAHDLGASGLYIGLIFGAFSLSRTILLPYFGRLSDKKGRKPVIVAGLLFYAIVSAAFLFSTDIKTLILFRFIQGIASAMIMPVCQAYVGDITPVGKEGFFMGMFNMSMFFGLSIGPLIGGFVKDYYSLDTAFACMGFLSLTAFIISLFFLPPTITEKAMANKKSPKKWKHIIGDRNIAGLFIFRFAYTASIGIIWSFLPVFTNLEFSLSGFSTGILVTLGVLISGILHTPMGIAADKFNKQFLIATGGFAVVFSMLFYGKAECFNDLLFASILFGIGGGISMPALMAIAVYKGKETDSMGSVMALITTAHSLGMLIGSLAAGLIMDMFRLRKAFYSGAGIMVTGIILFLFLMRDSTNYQRQL
ncbi:MAG: MFS transporter [Desulfobacteraceae bacterium]|nr:MAG: MFS transporter [Desulfobacteraceae bacterium]